MLIYKAMYKFLPDGVHAEVLDFPGTITCGKDLNEARRLLSGALSDMAETHLSLGESLPLPNSSLTNAEADLEEPIYLLINASSSVMTVPQTEYETA